MSLIAWGLVRVRAGAREGQGRGGAGCIRLAQVQRDRRMRSSWVLGKLPCPYGRVVTESPHANQLASLGNPTALVLV
eukprot:764089-Pyramimonas_sp.AAC.1